MKDLEQYVRLEKRIKLIEFLIDTIPYRERIRYEVYDKAVREADKLVQVLFR